jgi:hypothetical protein
MAGGEALIVQDLIGLPLSCAIVALGVPTGRSSLIFHRIGLWWEGALY